MFARFGKILVIVALVVSTGGHWAMLQTVAWTTMLADNLRTHSIAAAVTCTFDGQHPCCLCKAIAAAKKSEKKNEFPVSSQKFEFPPSPENVVLVAPYRFQLLPQADILAEFPRSRPPTPPPRGLFA